MEDQSTNNPIAVAEETPALPKTGENVPRESRALMIGVAGWLLPGLGHALQLMWGRALVVFLAVGLLVGAGASMRGNVFTRNGNDAFDKLGFIADLGTGTFYVIARTMEKGGSDVSHAGGDYGTRLLATAGVLNLLAALHAYEAARGRKA
jgi:mannose/fructose/N-acetylgalactosamine-specific phosphotransferase system component IIC